MMAEVIRRHLLAVLIAALFVVLATTYSLVTPLFEASDEIFHFPVIYHIVTTGQLPRQNPDIETMWEQEGNQPPLYYLLGAGLTFWMDMSDLEEVRWQNPHAKLGIPGDPDNKNMVIHTDSERFPWRGTVLAVHLVRFLSVTLGTGTVILSYLLALTLWPERQGIALLSMALVALNPMFLFITGSVNNDNLAVMLNTWGLLLLARILTDGLTLRRGITLSVVTALGTISKISGLTLVPLIGLVMLIHALRTRQWRQTIYLALGLVGAWLALAGWWYARNLTLYGELLGLKMMVAVAGGRDITLWELRREWYGFWVSYWGLFGSVNILMDQVAYTLCAVLTGLGLGGLLLWAGLLVRRRVCRELWILAVLLLYTLVVFVGVVRWTMTTYASQGRLMFPAISAISSLLAVGLVRHFSGRWERVGVAAISVPLLAVAVIAPFRYIAPTYSLPERVESVPDEVLKVGAHFHELELVAVEVQSPLVREGGRIPITLYWRLSAPTTQNYSIYLHALGLEYQEIGKVDSYPGGGTLPTSRMKTGAIIEDTYSLELDTGFDAPTVVRIAVGAIEWLDDGYQVIDPVSPNGQVMSSVILDGGVAYPASDEGCAGVIPSTAERRARFVDFTWLWFEPMAASVAQGDDLPITLFWEHDATASADLTVFIHLLDQMGNVVAQADGPPLDGFYPTSAWRMPCQIRDVHHLLIPRRLPVGEYELIVGLYDPADVALTRTPVVDEAGTPYTNYAVPLGTVRVEAP